MEQKKVIIGSLIVIVLLAVAIFSFDSESQDNSSEIPSPRSFEKPSFSPPDGVEYHVHRINNTYRAGDRITGTVNLSLDGSLGDYIVSSNFENNLSLLDFLDENNFNVGVEYNCSTSNCLDDYASQGDVTSLLLNGEDAIAGFSITGENVFPVNDVSLTINSDAGPSCFFPQLFVDVLNNEEQFVVSSESSGEICQTAEYTGCFDSDDAEGEVKISQNDRYCELLELPAGPGFALTARVKNSTEGPGELNMLLYRADDLGEFVGDCMLPEHTQEVDDLTCIVAYSSPVQDEYFACVTATTGGADYKIRFETEQACGTNHNNFGSPVADYEISAQAIEFAAIDNFALSEAFMNTYNDELANQISSYISEVYGGNCVPSCSIPLRFIGQSQELFLSDISIEYDAEQGTTEVNSFHRMEIEPVTLDSAELELDLAHANFVIPIGSDEDRFELYIDDELIFDEGIALAESFEFDITPKFVGFGQDVLFEIETDHTINTSTWDFGDGTIETVSGKEIRHRYVATDQQEFTVEVTLERSDGAMSTASFSIVVGDAEEIANQTIREYRQRIADVRSDIDALPSWITSRVTEFVDVTALNVTLNAIENDYNLASSDGEFRDVMLDLIALEIPHAVNASAQGAVIPLLIGVDNAEARYIEEISGTIIDNREELLGAVAGWMSSHFDALVSFEHISILYDARTEVLLSRFTVQTNPITDVNTRSYFIINQDIEADGAFMGNYGQQIISSDGTYITLEAGQASRTFEFFVLGEFEPADLGMYISPVTSELGEFDFEVNPCNFNNVCEEGSGETSLNCEADCSAGRWPFFYVWIIVLLFVALVVYVILQEWYKRHYEDSLFKNKNDLYNLVNFIYNARKAGFKDAEAKKKLAAAKWKGEQVTYAFKKIDGKRTGMYEIPIFKFLEKKKVKKELAKRQRGGVVDRRFVNQRRGFP